MHDRVYIDYYKLYLKYKSEYNKVKKLENKRISLLVSIGSLASNISDIRSSTNAKQDKMLKYVADKEEIEHKINDKKSIVSELKFQLSLLEEELKQSKNIYDKVYYYKYICNLKYYQIASKINYEKTRTYDFIKAVEKEISKIK